MSATELRHLLATTTLRVTMRDLVIGLAICMVSGILIGAALAVYLCFVWGLL